MKKTINDLHVMLVRIEERQKHIADSVIKIHGWQEEHEKKDEARFSSLNRYAASIATVSAFIGMAASYVWKKFTGES